MTMMERAKRPMSITAGKLLDLSLNTFTVVGIMTEIAHFMQL